jgi:hypothetical protein
MKTRFILPLLVLLLLTPALALLLVSKVTPESTAEGGATMQYRRLNDGTYTFTFTRHMASELRTLPDSKLPDLNFNNFAMLEVRSGDKLLASTRVAGEAKDGTIVYNFTLARDCIAQSRFLMSEYVENKDPARPRFFGDMMYELDLADIDKRLRAAVPEHP